MWNVRRCGKYATIRNGEVVKAGRKERNGKERKVVFNSPADWIAAERPDLAIVRVATWDAVQERLAANRNLKSPAKGRLYLFTGLLKCGDCGRPMHGFLRRGRLHYRCGGYAEYGRRDDGLGCHHNQVDEAPILTSALAALERFFLDPATMAELRADLRQRLSAPNGRADEAARLDAEIAAKQKQVEADAEKWFEAPKDLQETLAGRLRKAKEALAKLEAARKAIEAPKVTEADLEADLERIVSQVKRIRAARPSRELATVLRGLFARIEVSFERSPAASGRERSRPTEGLLVFRQNGTEYRDIWHG
jgi:site-specific DNA recombinase